MILFSLSSGERWCDPTTSVKGTGLHVVTARKVKAEAGRKWVGMQGVYCKSGYCI